MSFETLKEQVDALTDAERRRLMAHLVSVEQSKNAEHGRRMAEKINCQDPSRWLTLEEVENRLHLNDGPA